MAGLSEIFTQDLEDMPHGALESDAEAAPQDAASSRTHAATRRTEAASARRRGANAAQRPESSPAESGDARALDPRDVAALRHERLATERQVKLIRVRLERAGIAESELLERFGIPSIESLPFSKVSPALHWIEALAA